MKSARAILCLLLTALILMGCAPGAQTEQSANAAPDSSGAVVGVVPQDAAATREALARIGQLGESLDDNYRTWYEIFVYSFCDSNGDGIGDIPGVISKLDYLQELGINGIWLMPVHPSQSYHKYDVRDYYGIDPAYGTVADMEALLAECEKRDIHVILDLVLNHTGNDHPWFTQLCQYLRTLPEGAQPSSTQCKYVDYYFLSPEPKNSFHAIEGSAWYYEGKFSPDMPDLNLEHEAVRQEIREIMTFWFDRGAAGFRLDAAKEFYSGDAQRNTEVLRWIVDTAKELKPDVYMVAEVWDSMPMLEQYYKSGISSLFNFPLGTADGRIVRTLRGAGDANTVSAYAPFLQSTDETFLASNPDYIDAPFLSNHDVGRIAGFVARQEEKVKLAGAMNLFMSGSAFLYYGEELGMVGSGNDPSKRAPMYWNQARDGETTDPPPECSLPDEYPFPSLELQRNDDNSIYNYYRQAIAIRQAIPAISRGRTTAEEALNAGCVSAYRKTWGEEMCIILMNIAPEAAAVDLSGYGDWQVAVTLTVSPEAAAQEGAQLVLPPFATAVLTPNP